MLLTLTNNRFIDMRFAILLDYIMLKYYLKSYIIHKNMLTVN